MGRALAIIGGGALLAVLMVVVAGWLALRGFVQDAGITTSEEKVYPLRELTDSPGDIALLLYPPVTGDAPAMITDRALLASAASSAFWTESGGLGQALGSFTLMMMGAPASTPIAATYRDGGLVTRHACPWSRCGASGRDDPELAFDFSMLAAEGTPVRFESQTFTDYDAYRSAHAAIAADPSIWFDTAGAEVLAPAPDGLVRYDIFLPAVFWETGEDGFSLLRDVDTAQDALRADMTRTFDGTGLIVEAVTISRVTAAEITGADNTPILLPETGLYLRPLGYSALSARLTIAGPDGSEARLRATLDRPHPALPSDATRNEVIAIAAEAAGLDPTGLDFMSYGPAEDLEISRWPDPFWTLETVHLLD